MQLSSQDGFIPDTECTFKCPTMKMPRGSCSRELCCLFSAELSWNGLGGGGKQNKIIPHQLYSKAFEARSVSKLTISDIPFRILYLKGLASIRERKFTWEKSKNK